jgi:hypothetical protein
MPEVFLAAGRQPRKKPATAEQQARVTASRRAAGHRAAETRRLRGTDRLIRDGQKGWLALPKNRALMSLERHLRHTPEPSEELLRKWVRRVAEDLGVCISEAIAWWNPWLHSHRLSQLGGRPGDSKRCQAMCSYLGSDPRVYGMWRSAPEPKSWCQEHARGCPTMRRELARVRIANRTETPSVPLETAMSG